MMKYYSSKDFKLFHDLFLMELKEKPHIQEHMVEKGISEMHLFGAQIYLAGFYVNQDELVKRVMHIAEKRGIDSAVAQKHLPKLWIPNYAEIYSRAKPVISDLAITRVAMMVDDFLELNKCSIRTTFNTNHTFYTFIFVNLWQSKTF
jgi:hypothetical protein